MDEELAELIGKKRGDVFGLIGAMLVLSTQLAPEDLKLFCETPPYGEDLWDAFRERQAASENTEYDFVTYANDILQELKLADAGEATGDTKGLNVGSIIQATGDFVPEDGHHKSLRNSKLKIVAEDGDDFKVLGVDGDYPRELPLNVPKTLLSNEQFFRIAE
jgi:hypothetical protein